MKDKKFPFVTLLIGCFLFGAAAIWICFLPTCSLQAQLLVAILLSVGAAYMSAGLSGTAEFIFPGLSNGPGVAGRVGVFTGGFAIVGFLLYLAVQSGSLTSTPFGCIKVPELVELFSWNNPVSNRHVFSVKGGSQPDVNVFVKDGAHLGSLFVSREADSVALCTWQVPVPNKEPRNMLAAETGGCSQQQALLGYISTKWSWVTQGELFQCLNPSDDDLYISIGGCGPKDHALPSLGFLVLYGPR